MLKFLEEMMKNIKEQHAYTQAYDETKRKLSNLSDRQLNDIGLTRYDIDTVCKESAKKALEYQSN